MSIDSDSQPATISTQAQFIDNCSLERESEADSIQEEMQVAEENAAAEQPSAECTRELEPIQEETVEVVSAEQETSVQAALLNEWSQYSPEEIQLELPELPPPDYNCYAPPEVPAGVTKWIRINEPVVYKELAVNLDKLAVENRVNNTHVNRDKTVITNVNRHHDHMLKVITNENNYEKNITNKLYRVADIHKQRIENVAGPVKVYKEYKLNQKIEGPACQKQSSAQVITVPATTRLYATTLAQRVDLRRSKPSSPIVYGKFIELSPPTPTPVRYI